RHAKEKKELLYMLKDRGIAAAYVAGRLQYLGKHGGLAIYRGEGYCFHSTLEPVGAATAEDTAATETRIFVEAKPRGATEPRLTDAVETLQSLQEPSLD